MIRREKGELLCECDGCGTEFAGGCQDDFHAFIRDLKVEGWKIVKVDDHDTDGKPVWEHYCDECLEEGR